MSRPVTPYFLFCRKQHFIDLSESAEIGNRVSRLTLVSKWDSQCIVYDSAGTAWGFRFQSQRTNYTMFDRLLAEIYNPVREVPVIWSVHHEYSIPEIQEAYLDALAHDDDILTQFVEAEELERRIRRCQDFQDLTETWHWMQTDSTWQKEPE
jgi:hypothetical protein